MRLGVAMLDSLVAGCLCRVSTPLSTPFPLFSTGYVHALVYLDPPISPLLLAYHYLYMCVGVCVCISPYTYIYENIYISAPFLAELFSSYVHGVYTVSTPEAEEKERREGTHWHTPAVSDIDVCERVCVSRSPRVHPTFASIVGVHLEGRGRRGSRSRRGSCRASLHTCAEDKRSASIGYRRKLRTCPRCVKVLDYVSSFFSIFINAKIIVLIIHIWDEKCSEYFSRTMLGRKSFLSRSMQKNYSGLQDWTINKLSCFLAGHISIRYCTELSNGQSVSSDKK